MSELLAKALESGKIGAQLTKEDAQKVIEYLRAEGGLNIERLYKASDRRGYVDSPGAGEKSGKLADPHRLAEIIQSGLINPEFYNVNEYVYELQMTMFQAVGGMDAIAKAVEKKVAPMLRLGCEVSSIQNKAESVTISYKEKGIEKSVTGDYCICTLPLPVLSNISHNFSGNLSRAIDFTPYIQTGKIGLQFKRRFWEEDEQIYGGITHTNNDLTQIFYPSNDYLGKKGILIGYYNFNEKAKRIGELSLAQRQEFTLQKGRLIHPQYDKEFAMAFSVCWHKTPYSMGG